MVMPLGSEHERGIDAERDLMMKNRSDSRTFRLGRREMLLSTGAALTSSSLLAGCATGSRVERPRGHRFPAPADPGEALRSGFFRDRDREMIESLGLPRGGRVLDAGAGIGDHSLLLAEAVGCSGSVTAIDLDPGVVAKLRERVSGAASFRHVHPREGDVHDLPVPSHSLDLAWCSQVLHFMPDPVAVCKELARVCRRGGRVVIREDRPLTRFLPMDCGLGTPGLEGRLMGSFEAWLASDRTSLGRLPRGWLGVLHDAGLSRPRTRSFLFEVASPLDAGQRGFIRSSLRSWAKSDGVPISNDDRSVLLELSREGGPHDFAARDDVHFVSIASTYLADVV